MVVQPRNFDISPEIQAQLISGSAEVAGMMIRNVKSGKFIEIIPEVDGEGAKEIVSKFPLPPLKDAAKAAIDKSRSTLKSLDLSPKVQIAVAGGVLAVGAVGYGVAKVWPKKKQSQPALPTELSVEKSTDQRFDEAYSAWCAAAINGKMTHDIVVELREAVDAKYEALEADGGGSDEFLDDLAKITSRYSGELAELNDVELEESSSDDSSLEKVFRQLDFQEELFQESS